MKVLFIDGEKADFDGARALQIPLGGTATAFFELSRALAARNHYVTVANATREPTTVYGVTWIPRAQAKAQTADAVIVNNNAALLGEASRAMRDGAASVLWLHNPVKRKNIVGQGNLGSLLRHRPAAVFIGSTQAARYWWFVPRRRDIIPHGVSDVCVEIAPLTLPPPPRAIYTSQAYRGLNDMIALWVSRIGPAVPDAEFHAHVGEDWPTAVPKAALEANRIRLMPLLDKAALAEAMRDARVMIYPGHREETFCLAAAECLAAGTPVVTRGIGALSERVRNDMDGYIAGNDEEFSARTISILTDDALWRRLHDGALQTRHSCGWGLVAERWEGFLNELLRP